jgi:heat shock protein HslJ
VQVLVALVLHVILTSVHAAEVQVEISGKVEYNQVRPENSRMGNPKPGDRVTSTFRLDSTDFTNSTVYPTRGYPIIRNSLRVVIGSETFEIQDPLEGNNPLFILRNNDPKVDGFLIGSSVNGFENGAPLNEEGALGAFKMNFLVTYLHNPLPSLDILDAVGTYHFTGISSYHHTIDDGTFNPVGIQFEQMIITKTSKQTVEMNAFDAKSMSFGFTSLDGFYHSIEASSDLENWRAVGHYPGTGQALTFKDQRGDLGQTQFFRIRTQKESKWNGLLNKEWSLISMKEDNAIFTPKNNRVHTIRFKPDMRIEGRNDCNNYFGAYSVVDGNMLKFGDAIASTKVLCPPDSLDSAFFQALRTSKGFELTEENLAIYYGPESQNKLKFK